MLKMPGHELYRVNLEDARRPSMKTTNVRQVPVELPQDRRSIGDCGAQLPMSQQDAADSHGHEIHLQEFLRLVGCHESNAGKHEAVQRQHQLSAARR
jgi:hypothetical protein